MLDEMSKAELLLVIRNLRERIRAFESGEKYTRMKEDHRKAREADARLIRRRERELAEARRERIHTRDLWLDVIDKLQEEHEKEITKKDKEIARLKKELEKEGKQIVLLLVGEEIKAFRYCFLGYRLDRLSGDLWIRRQVNLSGRNRFMPQEIPDVINVAILTKKCRPLMVHPSTLVTIHR